MTLCNAQKRPQPAVASYEDIQRFTGKIVGTGEKMILKNLQADSIIFQLTPQSEVGQYEGAMVQVTGWLDTSTNTIRILEIRGEQARDVSGAHS